MLSPAKTPQPLEVSGGRLKAFRPRLSGKVERVAGRHAGVCCGAVLAIYVAGKALAAVDHWIEFNPTLMRRK
jgi:hypothetical protein